MAIYAGVSLHRFQRTRLDHDKNNLYVTSSLVEQPNKLCKSEYLRFSVLFLHTIFTELILFSLEQSSTGIKVNDCLVRTSSLSYNM